MRDVFVVGIEDVGRGFYESFAASMPQYRQRLCLIGEPEVMIVAIGRNRKNEPVGGVGNACTSLTVTFYGNAHGCSAASVTGFHVGDEIA